MCNLESRRAALANGHDVEALCEQREADAYRVRLENTILAESGYIPWDGDVPDVWIHGTDLQSLATTREALREVLS